MEFIGYMRTTKEFKKELLLIQPDLIVVGRYINIDTKILVKDKLGIKYLSTPCHLLHGKKPSITIAIDKNKAFEIKSKKIHNDKYVYKKVDYKESNCHVILTCKKHGDFKITPSQHLAGRGCQECGRSNAGKKRRKTTQQFIDKAKIIHKDIYDYSLVNYVMSGHNVLIRCLEHGVFSQIPENHLQGQGCPLCGNIKISNHAKKNSYGWSFSKWKKLIKKNKLVPRLYILKCYNNYEVFIKIGISMHEVKKRYPGKREMPYKFDILFEMVGIPENIFKIEQKIKKQFNENKFIPSIKFNGMFECYNIKHKNKILIFIQNFNRYTH